MTEIGEIALIFIAVRDQIKLYHWQTLSYARHKSSDTLVELISTSMDKFIETIQGKKNTRIIIPINNTITLENQTNESIIILLNSFKNWLINNLPMYLNKNDTDLFNMRDEILGYINQFLYLFTFN
jgi:hypothetical protein